MKRHVSSSTKSAQLITRVNHIIASNNLLQQGDYIVVAVSGGPDSLALLDILVNLNFEFNLVAVYIDHGLRPQEVLKEIQLLEHYCREHQVFFRTVAVPVTEFAQKENKSIEEAARMLRYEALQKKCQEHSAKAILTGHTADDQVELFFIRLVRGTSPSGLTGMRLRRGNIIRPLLFEKKQTLLNYLEENSITWCTDTSNTDRKFLRNRVRHDLLPLLRSNFNPSIDKNILNSIQILSSENDFVQDISDAVFNEAVTLENSNCLFLKGKHLQQQHLAIQRRIIERCCWTIGSKPKFNHIELVLDLLRSTSKTGELHLENMILVKKDGNDLFFIKTSIPHRLKKSFLTELDIEIPGPGIYSCRELRKILTIKESCDREHFDKTKLYLDQAELTFPLQLRSLTPGDRFHPYNAPGHKKVSRYFNDRKIPLERRQNYPLLVCGDEILAVLGLQIDNKYKISRSTTRLIEISWEPDDGLDGDGTSV